MGRLQTGGDRILLTIIQLFWFWQVVMNVDSQHTYSVVNSHTSSATLCVFHSHTHLHTLNTTTVVKTTQYNVPSLCFAKNTPSEQHSLSSVCVCVHVCASERGQ